MDGVAGEDSEEVLYYGRKAGKDKISLNQLRNKCTGECDEKGIPHSIYHECSRVSEQVFFYSDSMFHKIQGLSIDKGGFTIVNIQSGIVKQGWQDDTGKMQWNIETKAVSGEVNLGVSEEYIGTKLRGALLAAEAGVRVGTYGGKDIYLGVTGDIFGAGIEAGWDIENNRVDFATSVVIGGGIWFQLREPVERYSSLVETNFKYYL